MWNFLRGGLLLFQGVRLFQSLEYYVCKIFYASDVNVGILHAIYIACW